MFSHKNVFSTLTLTPAYRPGYSKHAILSGLRSELVSLRVFHCEHYPNQMCVVIGRCKRLLVFFWF